MLNSPLAFGKDPYDSDNRRFHDKLSLRLPARSRNRTPTEPLPSHPPHAFPYNNHGSQNRSQPKQRRRQIEEDRNHYSRIVPNALQSIPQRELYLIQRTPIEPKHLCLRLRAQRNRDRDGFGLL